MKTSTRFRLGRWFCLILVIGLIVSLTYIAYAHKDTDPDSASDTANNAWCRASAHHYHKGDGHGGYYNWQWAAFSASVGKKKDIGHKVDGSYSVAAYVSGAPGSGAEGNSFTLKVGGIKILGKTIIKWGDSRMANKSDFGWSSSPTTQGYAKAKSAVGSAKTKQCKT